MTPFLQLAAVLAIIITTAKLAGYVSTKIGQPSVFGELLLGIILGPSLLNDHLPSYGCPLGEESANSASWGVMLLKFLPGWNATFATWQRMHVFQPSLERWVSSSWWNWSGGGCCWGWTSSMLVPGIDIGATSVSIRPNLMEWAMRTRVGWGCWARQYRVDDVLVILLHSTYVACRAGRSGIDPSCSFWEK